MKKTFKKLSLNRETLTNLEDSLGWAVGASATPSYCGSCPVECTFSCDFACGTKRACQ
jgi:hypothetical protein